MGLESNLHWFNWFLYLYIWAMLLMPFVVKIDRRFGGLGLATLAIGGWLMECAIHQMIPTYTESIWLQALFDCLLVSPAILLGYWLARSGFLSRIPATWMSACVLTALTVSCVLARMWLPAHFFGFQFDGFYAAVLIACVAAWANLARPASPGVKALIALGEMSMLMWFIHAVFVMDCWRTVTDSWTLWLPLWAWPLRIALIAAFSYTVARLFAPLTSRLSSLIFSRPAFARV